MEKWLWGLILTAAVCAVVYLLYLQGFAVSKRITATLFVFRPGKGGDKVTLDSCTGWIRHVGRFRESRTYTFILDARLTKGDAEVTLVDRKKRQLLRLNKASSNATITLDKECRYFLRWEFKKATGTCELRWQ